MAAQRYFVVGEERTCRESRDSFGAASNLSPFLFLPLFGDLGEVTFEHSLTRHLSDDDVVG